MIEHKTQVRVRFAETDQMGVVYHSNYFVWFEIGRTSLLREAGLPYTKLEESGILLPVVTAQCDFLKSAKYDDVLTIHTRMEEKPRARIRLDYRVTNEKDEELATGFTIHSFIRRDGKPVRPPENFRNIMAPHFPD
ncbi:MAG: acyl-CoA thioesterase [Deferribacteres bacterium]|nr:acyl-CoA thioesterase [candidate division KSB1 bacterium]MCB9502249.1 acyl-CoA thioesterase [Deferribacteres bacterium]